MCLLTFIEDQKSQSLLSMFFLASRIWFLTGLCRDHVLLLYLALNRIGVESRIVAGKLKVMYLDGSQDIAEHTWIEYMTPNDTVRFVDNTGQVEYLFMTENSVYRSELIYETPTHHELKPIRFEDIPDVFSAVLNKNIFE